MRITSCFSVLWHNRIYSEQPKSLRYCRPIISKSPSTFPRKNKHTPKKGKKRKKKKNISKPLLFSRHPNTTLFPLSLKMASLKKDFSSSSRTSKSANNKNNRKVGTNNLLFCHRPCSNRRFSLTSPLCRRRKNQCRIPRCCPQTTCRWKKKIVVLVVVFRERKSVEAVGFRGFGRPLCLNHPW